MGPDCPSGSDCPDGSGTNVGANLDGEEGVEEEFAIPVRPSPPKASEQERDQHESTGHMAYRSWCGPCVQGRGRGDIHPRKDHSDDTVAVLSWDYGFLSSKLHRGD